MKHNRYTLLIAGLLSAVLMHAQAPSYLKNNEAQAYKANLTELRKTTKITIGDQMAKLTLKYGLTLADAQVVKTLITERETRKATYDFINADNDTTRYKMKEALDNAYQDQLVATLFESGKAVGAYNCRMIMRNRDTLRLSQSQAAQIAQWAVKVDRMQTEDPKLELRPLEYPLFKKLFTPAQLELFLTLKIHDEALGQAAKTWKTLKDNGLEYGMDSTATAAELYRYHMARDKAIYVNYDNATEREAQVKAINDAAPQAIRRTNSIAEAVKAKNAYNGTLTW